MSATSDYAAAVHARGWIYLPQLPATSNLGADVEGAPGARSPWSPDGSTYEIAPLAVQNEQGWHWYYPSQAVKTVVGDTNTNIIAPIKKALTKVAEQTGLDHGVFGLLAKALGIPPWVLVIALLFVGYAVLRQYRIVPPLRAVVT